MEIIGLVWYVIITLKVGDSDQLFSKKKGFWDTTCDVSISNSVLEI